ncbi:response regulator transcription factor [Aestuariibius insulae]|uniref:response regulator transcription factor n=1 Tax=Aestuariibius insulae TaxID=2058287 RepID=UPI00345E8FB5
MSSAAPSQAAAPEPDWALVVDDHPLFCDALELTLRSVGAFTEVATADHLEAALDILDGRDPPTIVILDLNLPDVSGLDGLIRLRTKAKSSPVIVVSSMAENAIIAGALKAGAAGFVPKHSPRSVFRAALDAIAAGNRYTPAGFIDPGETSEGGDTLTRLASLTNQQGRILQLICEGKLNKQIAYDLSIAETTVKAHVTAIMRKLGVQSRTQAVLVANEARFANVLPRPE